VPPASGVGVLAVFVTPRSVAALTFTAAVLLLLPGAGSVMLAGAFTVTRFETVPEAVTATLT